MKKLILLLILTLFMCYVGISGRNIVDNDIKHEIYIPSNTVGIVDEDVQVLKVGAFDIIKVDDKRYSSIKRKCKEIYGESIIFKGNVNNINYIIDRLNISIVDRDKMEDKTIIYGYSSILGRGVKHKGNIVNIELCYGNNMIEIGTPLIMGSY